MYLSSFVPELGALALYAIVVLLLAHTLLHKRTKS